MRLFAVIHRPTGFLLAAKLKEKLTPPGDRPPQEGVQEVLQTNLLQNLPPKSILATDSAHCYGHIVRKVLRAKKFKHVSVNHRANEYSRPLSLAAQKRHTKKFQYAGTQQLDSTWRHLKTWRPRSMIKKNQVSRRCSPVFFNWAFAFQFRHNAMRLGGFAAYRKELIKALWHA